MSPDRKLRRLTADLAALHPDDAAAILERLDPGERRRIENLMPQWPPFEAVAPAADAGMAKFDAARFSSWLLARMEGSDGTMTEKARATLRACAAHLYPAPKAVPPRVGGVFENVRARMAERSRT